MFKKYTQCYVHTPGDKPFNKDDLAKLAIVNGLLPGAFFGALTGLAVGLGVGGPIGAVVGLIVGLFSGITVGTATALTEASNQWRFHRLVCLTGVQCAIGTVRQDPERGDLGEFDNDQFFDLALMPHQSDDRFAYTTASDNYKVPKPGNVDPSVQALLDAHPANDVYTDPSDCPGSQLLRPSIADLPYDTTRSWLHIEAEGDFWVRMNDLGLALGALVAALALVTIGAGVGGGVAGAAIGCAIGALFGGIGCIIGAIIGAIVGAIIGAGVGAGISYAIVSAVLNAIFEADPGDVEDANVGDKALGPIAEGDKVALIGEHVYDGFHEGWHEIHPLMAVMKLGDESPYYLEWNPTFADTDPLPPDLPDMPNAITNLQPDDMRQGLNNDKFHRRAVWLRERWCGLVHEAFDDNVRQTQQGLSARWTIHPLVDGCIPEHQDVPR